MRGRRRRGRSSGGDVAWGTVVYRNAIERGIGVKLNLWDVPVLR